VNLGEPLSSYEEMSMLQTSSKMQVITEDLVVVGLIDSTQSIGKLCTRGSDQRNGDKLGLNWMNNTQGLK
jgi:hypothetical protein